MNFAKSLDELLIEMKACEQAPNLNMLQHGELVHEKYNMLMQQLKDGTVKHAELLSLYEKFKSKLPPPSVLKAYHVMHDCGKSLCLEIGEDGKRRFPNHAEISAKQYELIFPNDQFTTNLIRKDMDFHTLRGEELDVLCKHPLAPILYFTAWAEIMANAEMFGGIESDSYKIKAKRLIQACKKLLK